MRRGGAASPPTRPVLVGLRPGRALFRASRYRLLPHLWAGAISPAMVAPRKLSRLDPVGRRNRHIGGAGTGGFALARCQLAEPQESGDPGPDEFRGCR